MDTGLKVTDTPEESSFADIVAGDNVVNIPLFQRAYKWTDKNLSQFWKDIEDILDGAKPSQFLGVIVTVRQPTSIGRPTIYDIVDGQQRLFTCYIAIAAAVSVALDNNKTTWALEAARSYLLLRPFSQHLTNTKLVPSAADRQQFKIIWDEIADHRSLQGTQSWESIGRPTPPEPAGLNRGKLVDQYRRLVKYFRNVYNKHGHSRLEQTVEILAGRLSFVSISLRDPIAAPIIFERLNARGEKITTGDLVRNEIFARVAGNPTRAQALFQQSWEPFQHKFVDADVDLEKILFPYGLSINPNTTKAELFSVLRRHWSSLAEITDVIADIDRYSDAVIALETGTISDRIPLQLRTNLKRLNFAGAPSSIYSFCCQLIDATRRNEIEIADAQEILNVIEAFLARRAICGIEPTGLHSVFKGMWQELMAAHHTVKADGVRGAILARTTVVWPSDDALREAIRTGDLYHRNICKYAVAAYETAQDGETPADDFWIEHVLPQSLTDEWRAVFSDEEHTSLKNTFANLIPLTARMNNDAGQSSYADKRNGFRDSIFATARAFDAEFENWGPDELNARSAVIADWAVGRWPR